ncbi:uncharacterized protein METZ01_LOCUS495361, partial [marine metagenome]
QCGLENLSNIFRKSKTKNHHDHHDEKKIKTDTFLKIRVSCQYLKIV